jgi:hypothetical protein
MRRGSRENWYHHTLSHRSAAAQPLLTARPIEENKYEKAVQ